jgi:hypothetical protein
MNLKRLLQTYTALITLSLLSAPCDAQTFTMFSSRATWEAASPGFITETFELVPDQIAPVEGGILTTSNFNFIIDENHGDIAIDSTGAIFGSKGFHGDVHAGGTDNPQFNNLVFDTATTGFGLDYASVDALELSVTIGAETFNLPFLSPEGDFFGLTSDTPFSIVSIRQPSLGGGGYYKLDNVSSVPEPTTATLLLLGGAFYLRRRSLRTHERSAS